MSASREKQLRREQRAEGTEKRQVAKKNNVKKTKRNRTITTIVAIVVVIALIAVIILNSNFFYTQATALRIGNQSYTAAEFNYFYNNGYYSFVNSYGEYISYFLDTTQPLESQQYSEDQTWADYFQEQAIETMRQTQLLCDKANAVGFTLSEEYQEQLSASLASLSTTATEAGYNSVDAYLAAAYGRGCDYEVVSEQMARGYLASAYYEEVYNSFEYTQEQMDTYYYDNEDTYDYIEYIYYYASGSADEEAGIDAETAMATAQETADQISQLSSDETSFINAVMEVTEEKVESTRTQGKSISSIYSEFLLSPDRSYGDCEVFVSDYGYYTVMYLGRDDNHYNTVSVRHILIKAEADEDGTYSDEAKEAALARIEEIYDEWQEGEATEDSFAELANSYSDDGGSNTNGGLYEGIYKGQMVPEFNDFCFDESRQPGDTGIVYGESGSYAGYHVIYFVGEDDEMYSNQLVDADLRSSDYADWQTAELENYPATTGFAMRFAK